MQNEQTYIKGDKVWIEEPTTSGFFHKHPALVVSAALTTAYPSREPHIAVRYLDRQGINAYQCVPKSWITGRISKEQANNL